jgi:Flp pilus assembly protein TadG
MCRSKAMLLISQSRSARPWSWCVRNQRGAALVEMAVAFPLLVLLLFGVAEFGRAVWLYDTTAHAAREATRYAIVRGGESGRAVTANDIEQYVRGSIVGVGDAQVTTTWEPDNRPGSAVEVTVRVTFNPALPIMPSLPLRSTSRLIISF